MALSIAALGSVLAGVYTSAMPSTAPEAAQESIANAVLLGPEVAAAGREAFSTAMATGSWIGAVSCVAAACLAMAVLRSKAPRLRCRPRCDPTAVRSAARSPGRSPLSRRSPDTTEIAGKLQLLHAWGR
ncbi:hypothetical protein ACFQGX_25515 [Nonomuraea dietziae]|uniref:hypothetical protein n=1 Tax=Nonomuraea dietziae TaxID=65515 RepID=UPI00360D7F44